MGGLHVAVGHSATEGGRDREGRERNITKEMRLDKEGGERGPRIHTPQGGSGRAWLQRRKECEEGEGEGLKVLAVVGIVSLGLVLNVLQRLFVLFFSCRERGQQDISLPAPARTTPDAPPQQTPVSMEQPATGRSPTPRPFVVPPAQRGVK